jgi:signal transduction histidine kinase
MGVDVQPLTRIAEIRHLSREAAAKGLPVLVRGVVTWGSTDYGWFTIQDDSAGLGVDIKLARNLENWNESDASFPQVGVGMELEVIGVSHAAGFAPLILPKTVRILGRRALPVPRVIMPERFFNGADACERVEARGVVQGFQTTRLGDWGLLVNTSLGSFSAEVPTNMLSAPEKLVDAEVCLRGVAATGFNSRGELTGIRLLIGQEDDLIVEKPSPQSPFKVPRLALDKLMPFRGEVFDLHRKLVEGTVIYAQNERIFYLQDGDTTVRVETLRAEELDVGDRVQIAGFVDVRRHVAGLDGAIASKIGTAKIPPPESITPAEIMTLNTRAALTGQAAIPCDYDGHLITFRARLMDVQKMVELKAASRRLTLETDGVILQALLEQGNVRVVDSFRPGSDVQVTGIVQLDYAELKQTTDRSVRPPTGISILLPGPHAVVVLRAPSWWTPERLLALLAAGVIVLVGVLFWMWQLRRQLARKSMQLAAEMRARRDAAIEFKATLRERTRLAANLHDTLLQSISALNYQLEACETESLPRPERRVNYLASARRIVQHAQQDLRGTVWALRVLPLDDRPFAEALRALARQSAEGRDVRIIVEANDELPPFSDFVAGNLLLVAQEAIHNALKHAKPAQIETRVFAAQDSRHIMLEVRDDGVGFDVEASLKTKAGHFGLEGMRERLERLGGTLRIESAFGRGTAVRAEVWLGAYDEDLTEE